MPRPTKPLDAASESESIRTQVILDAATLRTLDFVIQANPDVENRSAAIRKLARDWRRKASR
jgi:hypothetical protein